jgi:hypothetical protein
VQDDSPDEELSALEKTGAVVGTVMYVCTKLNPTLALGDAVIRSTLGLWKRRSKLFANELISLNIDPPAERIRQREFLDALTITLRRVQETASDLKIKRFARLFASYYEGKEFASFDQYEEYVSILDQLGEREFQVLLLLNDYEQRNPLGDRNPLQRATGFWERLVAEVEEKIRIPRDELTPTLTRLQRTGLYEHFVGSYWDYTGGMGCVTPLFSRLLAALRISH